MDYNAFQLFRDVWTYLKPYRARFFLATFLRLSSDIVWLFPPWALSQIITRASQYTPGASLTWFWTTMAVIAILGVYHYVTHDLAKYVLYQISENARLDLIKKTLTHIFKLDPDWHEKENSGNKIQKIRKAGDSLDALLRMYIDFSIESTTNVIGITLVLVSLGTWVSAIMALFFLSYFSISRILTKRSSLSSVRSNEQWEKFEGVMFESVNNIATIRSMGFGRVILGWLERRSKKLFAAIKNRIFWYRSRSMLLNLWREFFRQGILLYVILNVFNGNLEVGVISLVLLYFLKVSDSAGELSEFSYQFELSRISLQRLREMLMSKPTAEDSGTELFPKDWGTIGVKDLHFAYDKRPVLKGISFTVKRGEKVGIVGISGAGKSTLFKLLLKLYDRYNGEIRFNKKELKNITRSSYLKHFAYVPQETELFNLSLKDNVTLALDGPVDEKRFKKAIEIAHVSDFLEKLPEGVDSLIGEKGIKLSGGERQRVGIARAIYRNTELLFMDEATSHLDADSEAKIRVALHEFFKGVTAIVIAHRLSTLKEMDRILVLGKGQILEEGDFKTLIAQKGIFHSLWEKQAL